MLCLYVCCTLMIQSFHINGLDLIHFLAMIRIFIFFVGLKDQWVDLTYFTWLPCKDLFWQIILNENEKEKNGIYFRIWYFIIPNIYLYHYLYFLLVNVIWNKLTILQLSYWFFLLFEPWLFYCERTMPLLMSFFTTI